MIVDPVIVVSIQADTRVVLIEHYRYRKTLPHRC